MSDEKSEPLLSDLALGKFAVTQNGYAGANKYAMGRAIRDFYENLIDTGVLMVVKEARVIQVSFIPREGRTIAGCSICGKPGISTTDQFCPGCGSKFTTAPASPSRTHPK